MGNFQRFYTNNKNVSSLILTEAISSDSMEKELVLVKGLLEKALKQKLFQEPGVNYFQNSEGSGIGIRYFIGDTDGAVRFNFDSSTKVTSFDIWTIGGKSSSPDLHVKVEDITLIKFVSKIVNMLHNAEHKDYEIDLNENNSGRSYNSFLFENDSSVIKAQQIKGFGLEYKGWGMYQNKRGESFEWDEQKRKFNKASESAVAAHKAKGSEPKKVVPVIKQAEPVLTGRALKIGETIYKNASEAIETLLQQGLTRPEIVKMTGASEANVYRMARKLGVVVPVNVTRGSNETNNNPDIKKYKGMIPEYADPKIIFEDLEDLIHMVTGGLQSSLLVTGQAGIGKTFTVTKTIEDDGLVKDKDWFHVKGKATPAALYRELFNAKDGKLIVFDDCDSVFKDDDAVNILKAALDSYDVRTISWKSARTFDSRKITPDMEEYDHLINDEGKYPDSFDFTGKVIFISNLHQSKIDAAIKSRSFTIDITLKASDVLLRIKSIMKKIMPEATEEAKEDALKYLQDSIEEGKKGEDVNIRTFLNAVKMRMSGSSNWKRLAEKYA
jgi:hypothetical protein